MSQNEIIGAVIASLTVILGLLTTIIGLFSKHFSQPMRTLTIQITKLTYELQNRGDEILDIKDRLNKHESKDDEQDRLLVIHGRDIAVLKNTQFQKVRDHSD